MTQWFGGQAAKRHTSLSAISWLSWVSPLFTHFLSLSSSSQGHQFANCYCCCCCSCNIMTIGSPDVPNPELVGKIQGSLADVAVGLNAAVVQQKRIQVKAGEAGYARERAS